MIGIIDAIKSETIAGGNFIFAAPLSGRLENIAKHCRAFGGYIFVPDAPESIHRLAVTCAECFVFLRFIGAIENRNGLDKRGLIDGGSEPADNLGLSPAREDTDKSPLTETVSGYSVSAMPFCFITAAQPLKLWLNDDSVRSGLKRRVGTVRCFISFSSPSLFLP